MTILSKVSEYLRRGLYLAIYGLFAALPMDAASALGSWLARAIGPRTRVQHHARQNLSRAFPAKSATEIAAILDEMWDNLGRVFGEFPHIGRVDVYNDPRIEVVGREHIERLRDSPRPRIILSAHFGNWELAGFAVIQRGPFAPVGFVYRAANDLAAEWLLQFGRGRLQVELIPKGARGARRIIEMLRAKGLVVMLPDQKLNNGIAVPFFGRPAMTPPALAQLALKFGCDVMPCRMERKSGTNFRMIFEAPIPLPRSDDRQADVVALMTTINRKMEDWIRERPGQWLWVHRRWPD